MNWNRQDFKMTSLCHDVMAPVDAHYLEANGLESTQYLRPRDAWKLRHSP